MYVFGALDHAAAVARVGSLLGFHITVCDARSKFLTRERFPEADELIMGWPDEFLRSAPIDSRTAICVITHDHKFDVPVLQVGQRCRLRRGAQCQEDQRGAGRAAAGGGNHR
jgi:xanthine dehydrogenase accessory factor